MRRQPVGCGQQQGEQSNGVGATRSLCTCGSVPRMFTPRILQLSYIQQLEVLKGTEKVFSFSNKTTENSELKQAILSRAEPQIQVMHVFVFKTSVGFSFSKSTLSTDHVESLQTSLSLSVHFFFFPGKCVATSKGPSFSFFFPPDSKYRLYKAVTPVNLTPPEDLDAKSSIKSTPARLSAER